MDMYLICLVAIAISVCMGPKLYELWYGRRLREIDARIAEIDRELAKLNEQSKALEK